MSGFSFIIVTNPSPLKQQIEKKIKDALWSDIEANNISEVTYLLDYDLDLIEVGFAMVENNQTLIRGLIADGLIYPPTKDEINTFNREGTIFRLLQLDTHALIQPKTN